MFFIIKVLYTVVFVTIVIISAILGDKMLSLLERTVLKNLTTMQKTLFFIISTLLIEIFAVWILTVLSGWTFLNIYFMMSFLFPGLFLITSFSRTVNENNAVVMNRRVGGNAEIKDIKPISFPVNPFFIGTLIFTSIGITLSIIKYLPYFLA